MKLRTLFLLETLVAVIVALGLLLGPTTILQWVGLSTGNTEKLLAQLIGGCLIGFGLLSWFAKDFADPQAQDGAVISLFIFSAISFVISLLGVFSKVMRSGGWLVVVIFLFFTLGYGYFQFIGPKE